MKVRLESKFTVPLQLRSGQQPSARRGQARTCVAGGYPQLKRAGNSDLLGRSGLLDPKVEHFYSHICLKHLTGKRAAGAVDLRTMRMSQRSLGSLGPKRRPGVQMKLES